MKEQYLKDLMTTQQVAELLDVHINTVKNWRHKKKGPKFLKLGPGKNASILYRVDDVKKFQKQFLKKSNT